MARKKLIDLSQVGWEAAYKSIKSQYPEVFIGAASDLEDYPVISTGSIGLDYHLGGGLEMSRVAEIYGPPYTGKSSTAYSIIAQYQKMPDARKVVYADVERTFKENFVTSFGVDLDPEKFIIVRGYDGESTIDIVENLTKSGDVGIFVIDSVTALIPPAEAQGTIKDDHMGDLARLMSRAVKRLVPVANQTAALGIFINQFRQLIGKYGDPNITTGGYALSYYSSYRIKVEGGAKSTRIVDSDGKVVGHTMKYFVEKNKTAPPFREYTVDLVYGKGFDRMGEILDWSDDLAIINRSGAWYSYGEEKLGQGRDNAKEFIEESGLYKKLEEEVRKRMWEVGVVEELQDEFSETKKQEADSEK